MEHKVLKKIRLSTLLYSFLAFFLLLLVVSLIVVYLLPRTSPALQSLVRMMPYPVLVIDHRSMVSYRELALNMDSVKRFYENQDFSKIGLRVDFSTDEGKKRLKLREKEVLNKMLEDEAIIQLARARGIFVTPEMAHQGVARKFEEYANQERVQSDLERLYGWDIADFEEKIVLPSLYESKLKENFAKEVDAAGAARKKIDAALQSLQGGTSFADAVKQYSDGKTADTDGSVGWFSLSDVAPELRTAVATQSVGVPGGVIESSLGFHILLVEEVKEEKPETLYRLSQIFARKTTFADWLSQEISKMSVWVLSPLYRFDTENTRVEFKDEEWKKFEEGVYKNMNGDPSFL